MGEAVLWLVGGLIVYGALADVHWWLQRRR
jgi:hypothetical protein